MKAAISNLSDMQRQAAIQRLTALWAFTECGLGGVMHAFQIPFTGLVVGGMAVVMISLIAELSSNNYKQIFKSALIVLIVKAMVSPYTPFPAYIAVSFQAVIGFGLFSLLSVNFFSILLLSTIAMLESAVQKLLILTLFFGKSFWTAMDSMITWLSGQFGSVVSNGSYWVVGLYLLSYLIGGFFIALLANRSIKNFYKDEIALELNLSNGISNGFIKTKKAPSKYRYRKLGVLFLVMIGLSILLFFMADDKQKGWLSVAKTISWTLSAIFIWFVFISPVLTKAIQKLLHKKQSRYSEEVLKVMAFLPVLKALTASAWQLSKTYRGLKRWQFFLAALIQATLVYTEPAAA